MAKKEDKNTKLQKKMHTTDGPSYTRRTVRRSQDAAGLRPTTASPAQEQTTDGPSLNDGRSVVNHRTIAAERVKEEGADKIHTTDGPSIFDRRSVAN